MDKVQSRNLFARLRGKICGAYEIQDYINHGKSALVAKAKGKDGQAAALKIFDPEMVVQYGGKETQLERISREVSLIGHNHPNLVQVLAGGEWEYEGTSYLYIAMEYLPGWNLAEVIESVPRSSILSIIRQLSSAAKFLDDRQICHRDIKPQNIAINEDLDQIKLLDLGVIRPFAAKPVTDGDGGRAFVGTTRYAPPEFALRKEEDSPAGWRSVTLYQIGAVLHDLITKTRIFGQYTDGSTALHVAIVNETPEISAADVPAWLSGIAKNCLVKDPRLRSRLVDWPTLIDLSPPADIGAAIDQLQKRVRANREALSRVTKRTELEQHGVEQRNKWGEFVSVLKKWYASGKRFPPAELLGESDTTPLILRIRLRPAATFGLVYFVEMVVRAEWAEDSQGICRIQAQAHASKNETDVPSNSAELLFHGVWDLELVQQAVMSYIVEVLTFALGLPLGDEESSPVIIRTLK